MMRIAALLVLLLLAGCSVGSYRDKSVPIASNAMFESARYAGTWHEIARFPTPFQRGCLRSTAQYTPLAEGGLKVVNRCLTATGRERQIEGIAVPDGPGRLRVSFDRVPFIRAPYWVLWVDEDYQTAVVGVPSGRAGWILNREPEISPDRLTAATDILRFNGYDTEQLIYARQTETP